MLDLHRSPDARAEATAPDAPFELVEEQIRGVEMSVFRDRYRS